MIIRALDENGDWKFGNGLQDYLTDQDAVRLNLVTRLKSWLNDAFWDLGFGIDWKNIIGSRNPEAELAALVQSREMIAQSFGVTKINSLAANTPRATRRTTMTFSVDSIFSRNTTGVAQP